MRPLILGYFLPKRGRNLLGILSFLCTAFFVYLMSIKLQKSDVIENPFYDDDAVLNRKNLGIDDCPVCFGVNETVCHQLLNSKVKIRTKKRHFSGVGQDLWKASAHGYLNGKKIIIKHLGNTGNFYALDSEICSVFGKINTPCNVTEVVWQSFLNPPSLERMLKEMLACPSKRLLSKVLETYVDKNKGPRSHHKVYFTTMLNLNQEPLIFQIFRAEHGWPFPKFYGSCGRTVVIEDVGLPLSLFISYPWLKRAKLALNVLKIAKRLTVNRDRWALYLTGTTQDSFAVSPNGTVKLMDADGFIVVDMSDHGVQERKKTVDRCNKEDPYCLTFTPHELCQGAVRDHNYYVICRSVLADIGNRLGLLHSPPDLEGFGTRLEDALSECVNAQTFRRIQAVELIVGLLRNSIAQEKVQQ